MDRAAAAGEFVEFGVENGDAFGAECGIQAAGMSGRDDAVIAQGQEVAGHRHDLGIGCMNDFDLAVVEEIFESFAEDVDAGHGEPGGGHAEQDIEMQEMCREGELFDFPATFLEMRAELVGASLTGADAGMADDQQAGMDDVDVAAFQCADGAVFVEAVILGVEIEQGGIFTAALGHGEAGEDRAPGRGLGGVPCINLIRQMRFRHRMVQGDAGGDQGRLQLVILREAAFGVWRGAGGQCGVGDGVGVYPVVVVRRAEQNVFKRPGFRIEPPTFTRKHVYAAFLTSRFCATRCSAIWTAFNAAPLRRLSETHQKARPFGTVGSMRTRLT